MCLPPPQPWVLLCAKPPALPGTAGGWWGGFGGSRARSSPSPFDKAKRPLPSLCKFCTVPESESLVSWGKRIKPNKNNNNKKIQRIKPYLLPCLWGKRTPPIPLNSGLGCCFCTLPPVRWHEMCTVNPSPRGKTVSNKLGMLFSKLLSLGFSSSMGGQWPPSASPALALSPVWGRDPLGLVRMEELGSLDGTNDSCYHTLAFCGHGEVGGGVRVSISIPATWHPKMPAAFLPPRSDGGGCLQSPRHRQSRHMSPAMSPATICLALYHLGGHR